MSEKGSIDDVRWWLTVAGGLYIVLLSLSLPLVTIIGFIGIGCGVEVIGASDSRF